MLLLCLNHIKDFAMLGVKPQDMTVLSIDSVIKIQQHPWWGAGDINILPIQVHTDKEEDHFRKKFA